jgi:hypothetical protein
MSCFPGHGFRPKKFNCHGSEYAKHTLFFKDVKFYSDAFLMWMKVLSDTVIRTVADLCCNWYIIEKKIDTSLKKDKATNPALQTDDYSKQTHFNEAPLFHILLFKLKRPMHLGNSVTCM